MTLTDTNWQGVFEDRLLHLLNRKEITSGFLPTNYSKPSQQTLENFMTEFMLCMPYNFIVTRDANGRFGMLDHFCTNVKSAHFGNIENEEANPGRHRSKKKKEEKKMSLASYICMDRQIPDKYLDLDDEDETLPFYIGRCFADENCLYHVKTSQFHKWYVYEISSHWGIEMAEPFRFRCFSEVKRKIVLFVYTHERVLRRGVIL